MAYVIVLVKVLVSWMFFLKRIETDLYFFFRLIQIAA